MSTSVSSGFVSRARLVFGAMLATLVLSALMFVGCGGDDDEDGGGVGGGSHFNPNINYSSFVDVRDSTTYKKVTIGDQVWMAENLNYNANNSRCYDADSNNCKKYGRMYTWSTATGGRTSNAVPSGVQGVCPQGWHLPGRQEWANMAWFIHGAREQCPECDNKLKSKKGWSYNGNGTDDYGFSALPGGVRAEFDGVWSDGRIGEFGGWWSSMEYDRYLAWTEEMTYEDNGGGSTRGKVQYLSVRCVEN